uniref:Uncharacterized protein n=1 Tax=Oryza nivara TaxID=4536 RepID=A0A0E0IDA0_ORYNI
MAATGKWQWMVAVERQSTMEGEDNGGGFRVRRLGQRGRRMCAPLQATRKRRDVDLGKGDDSPHWLSTLSSSLAPYAVAAAASSPPLSFPNADLVLRLHLDPCPTTTRISRLARITRREAAAGREERRRWRGFLTSAPAVLLLLPSHSVELPLLHRSTELPAADTNTVDIAVNPPSCCSRYSAEFPPLPPSCCSR